MGKKKSETKYIEKRLYTSTASSIYDIFSERPYFNQTSQVVNALEGTSVSLQCDAHGHPKPTVEWTMTSRNGSRTVMTLSNQDTLNLMNLDPYKDYGTYTCTASSALGEVTKTVQLNVYRKSCNKCFSYWKASLYGTWTGGGALFFSKLAVL